MLQLDFKTMITSHGVGSPAGSLSARVIKPAGLSGLPPLVFLHGISRNADDLLDLFRPEAERSGRIVIVPHFAQSTWPHFQRPCRAARPDQALLALISHLAAIDPILVGQVDLFGHSGGAQLAHRFAMLYPHKLGRLHLAAAGWYCLPDSSMAHPYGLGVDATPVSLTWARRHQLALPAFLRLPVRVYVGTADDQRDDALRQPDAQILSDLPPCPAAGQRQSHRFTPKFRRRPVSVSHRTPHGSSVGALHLLQASPPSW